MTGSDSLRLAKAMDRAAATLETVIIQLAGHEVAIRCITGEIVFFVDGIQSVSEYVFGLCE